MKVVIQKVLNASLSIEGKLYSEINKGLLVLVGFENNENHEDLEWMAKKVCHLRIFNDSQGIMNKSVKDIEAEILLVSQFTLLASTKKGNRPSYIKAARPEIAIPLYNKFIGLLSNHIKKEIKTGVFGADMQIAFTNNGPVTILIDSKNKE